MHTCKNKPPLPCRGQRSEVRGLFASGNDRDSIGFFIFELTFFPRSPCRHVPTSHTLHLPCRTSVHTSSLCFHSACSLPVLFHAQRYNGPHPAVCPSVCKPRSSCILSPCHILSVCSLCFHLLFSGFFLHFNSEWGHTDSNALHQPAALLVCLPH